MSAELMVHGNSGSFDLADRTNNISWETNIESSQAGKLTFDYVEDEQFIPEAGDKVEFKFNSVGVFKGRIKDRSRRANKIMQITAYDQAFYLKNQQTYVLPAMTSSDMFSRLCGDLNNAGGDINFSARDSSSFMLPPEVHDGKTLYSILSDALTRTLIGEQQWYIIKDDFGTLEHVNIESLHTTVVIGDETMATDYDFKGSISSDTYNRIRMVRDDPESSTREVHIAEDSGNISEWGLIQMEETVSEDQNMAQIAARGDNLLKAKNRETKELSIPSIGNLDVSAGCSVAIDIAALANEGIGSNERLLVTDCTHNWDGAVHTMDLTLRVI